MAATALTIRSAPTSFGFSIPILIPVFIPGPTRIGFCFIYFLAIFSNTYINGGTTEEIITPSIIS